MGTAVRDNRLHERPLLVFTSGKFQAVEFFSVQRGGEERVRMRGSGIRQFIEHMVF